MQILDEDGNMDDSLKPSELDEDKLKELYHLMVLVRTLDHKLFKLQRSGKIGTYAEVKGEEASEVGSAYVLDKKDWMVPSFRETGVYITRGVDRGKIVQAWNGDSRAFKYDPESRNLPISVPVGSQILHAPGLAWASKLRGEKSAAIVYFGDGATSEGDFHEALNFAGVLNLPVIFFCQNNQYAISTFRQKQTRSKTIAQKAIAYGIKGVQVDGDDVVAVYTATKEALERARNGEGPTLIESVTYRLGDHTTSDDSTRYRTDEEVEEWKKKDPLVRLKKYFENNGLWTDEYGKWVEETVKKEVEEAVEKGLNVDPPKPEHVFENVYAELPPVLQKEEEEFLKEWNKGDNK